MAVFPRREIDDPKTSTAGAASAAFPMALRPDNHRGAGRAPARAAR